MALNYLYSALTECRLHSVTGSYVYKYAVQDLHRKQVHVSSVPRHCVPSEISTAMRDGTETRSTQ